MDTLSLATTAAVVGAAIVVVVFVLWTIHRKRTLVSYHGTRFLLVPTARELGVHLSVFPLAAEIAKKQPAQRDIKYFAGEINPFRNGVDGSVINAA